MADVVAIYTRVSHQDQENPGSTRRQKHACRGVAELRGWQVAEVLEDVDVSAFTRGVRRPAFERLMTLVAGGSVNGVLVWKLDRLVRRAADFERFWVRCDQAGVFLASATEPIDSTTDLGLAVIRILVTFANAESEAFSLRLRSRLAEKARNGIIVGHDRRFGFTPGCGQIVEEEGDLIREAAGRILSGETVSAVVKDWNQRQILTVRGGSWDSHKLITLLNSALLVGDNAFDGEVVATACFPAILDRLTHARLRSAMANPKRGRSRAAKYLLSGFLRCGKCGGPLSGYAHPCRRATGELYTVNAYRCRTAPTGCAGVGINADFVENIVVGAVLDRLERRPRVRPKVSPPIDASEQLTAAYDSHAVAIRTLATDYYVEHLLTREEWVSARDGLELQLSAARRNLEPRWHPSTQRKPNRVTRFRADCKSFDCGHRRDIIASELEFASILPAPAPGVLDGSRVRPCWWDDDPRLRSDERPHLVCGFETWDSSHWMGTKEAASELGCSYPTVLAMVNAGVLSIERLGRQYRLRRSEVAQMKTQNAGTLSTAEVGQQLGIGAVQVSVLVRAGKLSAHRRGLRAYAFKPDDVRAFIAQREASHAEEIGSTEAAQLLEVRPGLLRVLIRTGEISATRDKTGFRLRREEVIAWASRRRLTMGSDDLATALGISRGQVNWRIRAW